MELTPFREDPEADEARDDGLNGPEPGGEERCEPAVPPRASRVALSRLRRALPQRTVRLRLSVFYGALLLTTGAALLTVTDFLVVTSTPFVHIPPTAKNVASRGRSPLSVVGAIADQRHLDLHVLLLRSVYALLLMVAVSGWLGWLMAGRVLRPLRTITATTRELSEENLHERLSLGGPDDELKALGDTIDGLLDRLERAFEAQRSFAANASHELRTPLTGIRVSIDVASRKNHPISEDALALAGKVRQDLDQADRLVESFLLLAKAQRGVFSSIEPVSLANVAQDALEQRACEVIRRNLVVHTSLGEATVVGNGMLLARMVSNVIDNAVRYSEPSGIIEVTTRSDGMTAHLVVESGGALLDQQSVDELVQPFKRLGPDRTASENGLGVGLAIVSAVATAHGGTLALRARHEGGLYVDIGLPMVASGSSGDPR